MKPARPSILVDLNAVRELEAVAQVADGGLRIGTPEQIWRWTR